MCILLMSPVWLFLILPINSKHYFAMAGMKINSITLSICMLSSYLMPLLILTTTLIGSVHFSCSVMSDSQWPHGQQHARLPCPSPTPGACSNSSPLSRWCHPTISSSVVPFSSLLQSFPASGSFPSCQFFASGGQSIGVSASASVLPMNIQDWFPLGLTTLEVRSKFKGLDLIDRVPDELWMEVRDIV